MLADSLKKIDVYFFDQIQKGNIQKGMKFLDAGCGDGRNLMYLIEQGVEVSAIDVNKLIIRDLKKRIASKYINFNTAKIIESNIETAAFDESSFDFILCSAVLHFSKSEVHFFQLIKKLISWLKPNGKLFIRMTCLETIENVAVPIGEGVFQLPDGSTRFLITKEQIQWILKTYKVSLFEDFKLVHIPGKRTMANLFLKKNINDF